MKKEPGGIDLELKKTRQKYAVQSFWQLSAFLFASLLLQEIAAYTFLAEPFSWHIFTVIIFTAFNAAVFLALVIFLPLKIMRWVIPILLGVMTVFMMGQMLYFAFFRTFFIMISVGQGGQLGEFSSTIIQLMGRHWLLLLVLLLPLISYFVFVRRRLFDMKTLGNFRWVPLLTVIVLLTAIQLWVHVLVDSKSAAHRYYAEVDSPVDAARIFGTYTAMRIDLRRAVFRQKMQPKDGVGSAVNIPKRTPRQENSEQVGTTSPGTQAEMPSTIPPKPVFVPQPQTLDIDFAALKNSTENEVLQQMDEYFSQLAPAMTNEYTGTMQGYNLIVITAESFSRFVIDPQLTPTLYHMYSNGVKMNNFYNPVWSVSTYDGEYVLLTGLYPKGGVWSLLNWAQCKQAFAYPNRLAENYVPFAFHNHDYDYYERDVSHPALGYTYYGIGNGLDNIQRTWPESDVELIEQSLPYYIDEPNFNIYYLTVSGHASYTCLGNAMATKNYHRVEKLPLSEEAKCYIACNLELEDAMKLLLESLRKKGVADRTLIVLNADHYPYAMADETFTELAGEEVDHTFELYRGHAIIYADGMKPVTVEKPCSSIDLMPTIYNLLGISYDSRLLMGVDVLSDEPGFAIFQDYSWISEYGRYNAKTKNFTPAEGVQAADLPDGYIDAVNQLVANRFQFSELILDYDYYSHVFPDLVTRQGDPTPPTS